MTDQNRSALFSAGCAFAASASAGFIFVVSGFANVGTLVAVTFWLGVLVGVALERKVRS